MSTNPQLQSNPQLFIREILDQYVRKNFENLQSYFNLQNQLYGFGFSELVFDSATNGFKFSHKLGSKPNDIIVTRLTGTGKVSFLYDEFDENYIVMDVDGPCRVRFFFGTYWNFTSTKENKDGDKMIFSSGV